jgi:drug/metabolite transporter (DMT)-like permease
MIIMWLICLRLKYPLPTRASEWWNVLVTGLFLQVGYQTFYFFSLSYDVSPGLLAIILGAQPIFTTLLMREKTTSGQWLGLGLGILGLFLVVAHTLFNGMISFWGIISALLSLTSITLGTMFQKKLTLSLPLSMAIQYTVGFVILTLLAISRESYAIKWSPVFLISLGWMALVVSVGATMLLFYMICQDNLTSVTSWFYCVPVVTGLFDYWIFGHKLRMVTIVGMALIVVGLTFINRRDRLA